MRLWGRLRGRKPIEVVKDVSSDIQLSTGGMGLRHRRHDEQVSDAVWDNK